MRSEDEGVSIQGAILKLPEQVVDHFPNKECGMLVILVKDGDAACVFLRQS